MKIFDPASYEEKWQQSWEQTQLFQNSNEIPQGKEKFFALFAFAYPSGSGLHVGHVESKTALDILVRFQRMQGKHVFFPVGWDAFGLPAENYAIKTGIHPKVTTKNAIDTFRKQVKRLGISYDWSLETATCHPAYYKWTQWIFIQLFKAGLAYRDKGWVNWCPQDKTVLANEQVVNGACERCGASVVQKELEQWKFRITKYQDELLSGLSQVDWPKATKDQQINWIGKSEGASVKWTVQGTEVPLETFTTRLDTIYGVTFLVISPEKFKEYGLLSRIAEDRKEAVNSYLDASFHKTEEQRRVGEKEKTGVDTGLQVLHPLTQEVIPLWIADYVLAGYGTGVVQGVPAHDARDHAFAEKFGIPSIEVIEPVNGARREKNGLFVDYGRLIHSASYTGLDSTTAIEKLIAEHPNTFARKVSYKLRDWLISRQRYWGAPIPMLFCENCASIGQGARGMGQENPGWYPVPEHQLPVQLPELEDFTPTDEGKSPIEKASDEWKYVPCPGCGMRAKREVDTMDTFVDSSWYFLRYASRDLENSVFDTTKTNALLPVDLYLIGPEHIVLHLLYARFFTKFLRDQGLIAHDEPFAKMRHQGMILGPDGKKMSKSKGNVITPDEIIEKFGADTLRMYEMFMGPLDADKAWDPNALVGIYRFLSRVSAQVQKEWETDSQESAITPVSVKLHWAISKLTTDIPELKFNTSIAALMEFLNTWEGSSVHLRRQQIELFIKILAPLSPFLAEELWSLTGHTGSIHTTSWPSSDPSERIEEEVSLAIQINGKLKDHLSLPPDQANDQAALEKGIVQYPAIAALVGEKQIKRIIVVPGRLINIVVGS